jgi:glycosyltransferase involved in cell wall biosynthesis
VAPVSIIISCYNLARYLPEAVDSALAQTVPALEVIVVDDGSNDETAEVVRRYPGVRYIYRNNAGAAAARNTGASAANGEYLIFLDADDRLTSSAVEAGLRCFEKSPDSGFVYGQGVEFDEHGFLPIVDQVVPGRDTYAQLLQTCFVWMIHTVMYAKDAFVNVGGYDETLRSASVEDYALNLAIARNYRITSHDSLVAETRVRPDSSSRNPGRMLRNVTIVMRKEKPHTVHDRARETSRRIGYRKWRARYVPPLARSVRQRILAGEWNAALAQDVATLTRHGPAAAAVSGAGLLRRALMRA